MEGINSTIILAVSVALVAWYAGQSVGQNTGRKRVRQEVQEVQGRADRLEERADRRFGQGGNDFGLLWVLFAVAGGVAALVLVK